MPNELSLPATALSDMNLKLTYSNPSRAASAAKWSFMKIRQFGGEQRHLAHSTFQKPQPQNKTFDKYEVTV